ncbi:type II secretion system F family protein [Mycobacterium sp. IDR2000157661]|uniref:type II secretion system F family protein n=1 Tax=Mycobacterium sp. IDR2000157661 TaxID=2867005 RepID=UPI001EED145A|nr:type II secretion system F family protein [Mycobacterium sp. IDR2000157661]ULE35056.1 type II secretion system F family protein [Mycobacterium sp. IDR2000157661]
MSGAAITLALALLVAPGPQRHRAHRQAASARSRPRIPVVASLLPAVLVVAALVPTGVAVAVGIVAVTGALRRGRRLGQRRRTAEATLLQGALDVLVGELRIGAHPVAAFDAAAREVDGFVAESLRTVAARARMGADVAAGLHSVARRSSLPAHWERLAVCWQLAHAHGLAVATLMQTAQRDIAARERFCAQVAAGMAGARTTATVLAGLPVLGIGLGQLIGAEPVRFLLWGGAGQWLLAVGVALSCAGLTWSDRITGRVMR